MKLIMENWNSYRQMLKESDAMNDMLKQKVNQLRNRRKEEVRGDFEKMGSDPIDDLEAIDDMYDDLIRLLDEPEESKDLVADYMDRNEMEQEFQELYGQSLSDYMESPEFNNSSIHDDEYDYEYPDF